MVCVLRITKIRPAERKRLLKIHFLTINYYKIFWLIEKKRLTNVRELKVIKTLYKFTYQFNHRRQNY
jgi:hypothetical protein